MRRARRPARREPMDVPLLSVRNVSKSFRTPKGAVRALDGVTIEVGRGETHALIGPNGAGKTTLLNILVRVLEPDEGDVRILGRDPFRDADVLQRVGLVSAETRFHWALSPRDVLRLYGIAYGIQRRERDARTERLLDAFGLCEVADRRFDVLSTGERTRLGLARALVHEPDVLLLDEPTIGLDPAMAARVRDEILRLGREGRQAILLTSHNMQEVERLAGRISFLRRGRIADAGTSEEIRGRLGGAADPVASLEDYFLRMVREDEAESEARP